MNSCFEDWTGMIFGKFWVLYNLELKVYMLQLYTSHNVVSIKSLIGDCPNAKKGNPS